ncbi:MAG: hypothetical protein V3W19_07470 [Desulfatiglandales bacterium]
MLFATIIVICTLWVYLDATGKKIGKIPGAGGMFNMSAGGWATVTLGLWIIGFPAYLIKRSSLIEAASQHPLEVKNRALKATVFGVIGALLMLLTLTL